MESVLESGGKLVIATHNAGKVIEISSLLEPYGLSCVSSGDLGLSDPEETGTTFEENALIKARSAARESGLTALADDSGLSVYALDGAPGIYSARWAGEKRDFNKAMKAVNEKMTGQEDRRAVFICVLALVTPDGQEKTFEGRVEGDLVWPPRGDKGFGYDPMFIPQGYDRTFGEMPPADKYAISHRTNAFRKLVEQCFRTPVHT